MQVIDRLRGRDHLRSLAGGNQASPAPSRSWSAQLGVARNTGARSGQGPGSQRPAGHPTGLRDVRRGHQRARRGHAAALRRRRHPARGRAALRPGGDSRQAWPPTGGRSRIWRTSDRALAARDEAWRSKSSAAFVDADTAFHLVVVAASHNPVLTDLYADLVEVVRDFLRADIGPELDEAHYVDHARLVEAIREGDAELAAADADRTPSSGSTRGHLRIHPAPGRPARPPRVFRQLSSSGSRRRRVAVTTRQFSEEARSTKGAPGRNRKPHSMIGRTTGLKYDGTEAESGSKRQLFAIESLQFAPTFRVDVRGSLRARWCSHRRRRSSPWRCRRTRARSPAGPPTRSPLPSTLTGCPARTAPAATSSATPIAPPSGNSSAEPRHVDDLVLDPERVLEAAQLRHPHVHGHLPTLEVLAGCCCEPSSPWCPDRRSCPWSPGRDPRGSWRSWRRERGGGDEPSES